MYFEEVYYGVEPLNYKIYGWNDNVQNNKLQFFEFYYLDGKSMQCTSLAS